jgi:hypothetical protein
LIRNPPSAPDSIIIIMPTEMDDDPSRIGAPDGCIDEVAQANGNDIHEQQEGKKAEPKENPDVPCVHKPEGDNDKAPNGEVDAAFGIASCSPTDGVVSFVDKKAHTADGVASVLPGRAFPELLYEIISDPTTDSICSWLPHGKGFMIHDKNTFAKEILPKYFDGAKFTS